MLPAKNIRSLIYEIRDQKVMLDFDIAQLYNVETRVLKQTVKRNIERFPLDFMFVLAENEVDDMVSQIVIPSKSYFGGALPFAFTEQGVAMLSGILKSKTAIEINIAIMRAFVFVRQYALSNKDLSEKLQLLEEKYDQQFSDVYQALNYLIEKDKVQISQSERKRIGFHIQ